MGCGMLPSNRDQLGIAVLSGLTLCFLVALELVEHHAFLAPLTRSMLQVAL